ncbi:MAG: MTH895/ArsE family thioredoxin-like protein [Chloroflexota bacterium]
MTRIKIVGAGCPACKGLEADVRAWVAEHHPEIQVARVDDLVEILNCRLLALPGLIVDDRVVMTGYHPRRKLDQILRAGLVEAT